MSQEVTRIAMWSGPRNISTAMMRSFENRADSMVVDEPLYAHYLKETGIDHPGRDEILAAHENDWRKVVESLLGPVPDGVTVFYQKHMTHHLVGEIEMGWIEGLTNVFLIRDPQEMLTSLIKVLPNPTLPETGLIKQLELFRSLMAQDGKPPLVIDSKDVLQDPQGVLDALCCEIGIPHDPGMFAWPQGPRDSDGVWARHWYGSVEKSTSFSPYRPKNEDVPEHLQVVLKDCQSIYDELFRYRITA